MSALCRSCGTPNRDQATFCVGCGQPLLPATATGALAAQTLLNGRYEIAQRVGGGGMGAVYQAFDFQQDRPVAIKEMSDQALGVGHREQAVEQFRREALLLQALSHPNLVKVTDTFSEGRRHYLVMDFVDGQPLTGLIAPQQEGWQEQVRAWALQLCDVLNYLHTRQPQVIFRDLKPDNILVVAGEEHLKLIDFGIARFFDPAKDRDTMAIGTPGFMAPEAFYGQTDARSDLYSLGVTMYTLLTGYDPAQSPWQLPPVAELAPQVAEDLAQIVAHAVELDPEQRFQTAQEFKRALGGEVLAEEAVEVAPAAAPVAARVSTARPVRFNGREQVTSLPQLIGLCETHWDAAVNHLRVGELEVWLDYLGETDLARYAPRSAPGIGCGHGHAARSLAGGDRPGGDAGALRVAAPAQLGHRKQPGAVHGSIASAQCRPRAVGGPGGKRRELVGAGACHLRRQRPGGAAVAVRRPAAGRGAGRGPPAGAQQRR